MSTQGDHEELIKKTSLDAVKYSKEPIKITWKNLTYTVSIPVTRTDNTA